MARRLDKRFLIEHVDTIQRHDPDSVDAESLLDDDICLDDDCLDPNSAAAALSDEEDEEGMFVIEVELFDDELDDELDDAEA
jgi:hypothetical protein